MGEKKSARSETGILRRILKAVFGILRNELIWVRFFEIYARGLSG
jgi:hypothetical protein